MAFEEAAYYACKGAWCSYRGEVERRLREDPPDWLELPTLDELVIQTALREAQRLTTSGTAPEHAADISCQGAWRPFREEVARRLREDG